MPIVIIVDWCIAITLGLATGSSGAHQTIRKSPSQSRPKDELFGQVYGQLMLDVRSKQ